MYGQRLEQRGDVAHAALVVAHVVYSALIVTYSWPRSEKKTSVSAPLAAAGRSRTRPRRPATACGERRLVVGAHRAGRADLARPRSRCRAASGAASGSAPPTACAIRPQFGSPPCSAVLTSGELATARADALDRVAVAAAHDDAADPLGALAVARRSAARAGAAARRAPRRSASSSSRLGLDRARRSRRSPSGSRCRSSRAGRRREMRSNERLTRHAEQQVGGLGGRARRRSGRSRASSRSSAGSSPRPCTARSSRTVPPGSSTSQRRALLERVGRLDRGGEVARRRRRAARRARPRSPSARRLGRRAARRSRRSSRPRPGLGRRPRSRAAAPCICAALLEARARRSRRSRCRS